MKSWVAAPSLFCAGSRFDHAPAYPALSRTVIDPPDLGAPVAIGVEDEDEDEDEDGVELVLDGDELLLLLLHAAAVVSASTAAPARQAVRTVLSRKLTAFTYS
jgi:hypothetical protein